LLLEMIGVGGMSGLGAASFGFAQNKHLRLGMTTREGHWTARGVIDSGDRSHALHGNEREGERGSEMGEESVGARVIGENC